MSFKRSLGRILIPMLPVNRRTFDILRHELRAARAALMNRISPAYHFKRRRLRRQKGLSVNIGSGGKGRKGWINVDVEWHKDTDFRLDIRRRLPFATGSVKRILAEHVVEHVDFRHDVPPIFAEFHRILEPGGTARVIVPDAERFLRAYASGNSEDWRALGWNPAALPEDIHTPMHIVNHIFHQSGEHLFAYDFATLEFAFKRAGFETVLRQAFRGSRDPELAIDQENHRPYSLYVEAVR